MKTLKNFSLLFVIAALAVVTSSCKKNEADTSNLKLAIQATNNTYSLPVNAGMTKSTTLSPSITWVSGTMFVSQLKFKAEMGESSTASAKSKTEYSWKGPRSINLFDTTAILGNITLPLGYYDKIELEVKLSKTDAAGTPVIYLAGNYTNASGTVIPVNFTTYEDLNLKAKQDGETITALSGSRFTVFMQIFMNQMLTGMTLEQLDNATITDNKIEISATSNTTLYALILNNMKEYHHCNFEND